MVPGGVARDGERESTAVVAVVLVMRAPGRGVARESEGRYGSHAGGARRVKNTRPGRLRRQGKLRASDAGSRRPHADGQRLPQAGAPTGSRRAAGRRPDGQGGPHGIRAVGGQELVIALGPLLSGRVICAADLSAPVTVVEVPKGRHPTRALVAGADGRRITLPAGSGT